MRGSGDPHRCSDGETEVGVRNRLVHEYDEIDDARVLAAIREAQRLIPRYVEAIEGFLRKQGL